MRRVATDVGGTFTDLVFQDFDERLEISGKVHAIKASTTPPNFEKGVLDTIEKACIDPASIDFFAHGTTVVINALLSRQGAKVGLITTQGFRDVLEIARGNRPDLFNYTFKKPRPFVPRYLRREVHERLDHSGAIVLPLSTSEIDQVITDFKTEGVEAIAICLLHAYINPTHEAELKQYIKSHWPDVSVLASHEISREWREYERTSTTVLSAYVHPVAEAYLDNLDRELSERGFQHRPYIMQSNGGITTINAAKANPVSIIESGPASGMLGAVSIGRQIGEENIIALDIGGTTAKCSLIENSTPHITTDYYIERTRKNPGYPIKTPVIDLVEIGNGGGSIAWLDEGGTLHVGPQSAGALPGPASYGRGGTTPTTTDANLLLGKINPDTFAGGEIIPDMESVNVAFESVAEPMGCTHQDLARGIVRIANANMVNALKLVSVNRGYDPRDFCLLAFGGGGAMHAADLAVELSIPKVIIPRNSAVFSAWGMLMTDLRRDYLRTLITSLDDASVLPISEMFAELVDLAQQDLVNDGIEDCRQIFERQLDMRYHGQEHTVKVSLPPGDINQVSIEEVIKRFHGTHERSYGYRLDYNIEVVTFHLTAWGQVPKSGLPRHDRINGTADDALLEKRYVDFDTFGVHKKTPVYDRDRLPVGCVIKGPALIEEASTVTTVLPGQNLSVDVYGNLIIHINEAEKV